MAEKRATGSNGQATDEALDEAREAAEGGMPGLLAGVAEKVGATARVSAVFGEPGRTRRAHRHPRGPVGVGQWGWQRDVG